MELKEALASLDKEDSSLWTEGGLPKVDVMKELTGDDSLTRQAITDAAPQFTRENPVINIEDEEDEDAEEGETVPEDEGDEEEIEDVADEEVESMRSFDLEAFDSEDPVKFYKALLEMDSIAEVEQVIGDIDLQVEHLLKVKKGVDDALKYHAQNKENAKNRIVRLTPPHSAQKSIMEHIAKQNATRAQKAGAAAAAKAALGELSLKDLDPRSPLDRAMERKNKRGTQRPTRI